MSSDTASTAASVVAKGQAAALQLVKCKLSASLLPGNLVCSSKSYAYIHRNEVQIIDSKLVVLGAEKAEPTKSAYSEKDIINQIEFIKVAGLGEVLVILNQGGGVWIYDETGQKLIHSYKHTRGSTQLTLKELHLRGLAYDGRETLYVGSGSGELLVFTLTKAKLSLLKSISDVHSETSANGGGISALAFSVKDNILISADDYGTIVFWSGCTSGSDANASRITRLDGKGSPCNLLQYGQGYCIGAFGSGHIRIYDLTKKALMIEIAAHTRTINGMDIHHTRPIVLVGSEDTFTSVWQLPTAANGFTVKHINSESPVLGLLTGVRFGGANQELVVSTTYDNRALALMHTP